MGAVGELREQGSAFVVMSARTQRFDRINASRVFTWTDTQNKKYPDCTSLWNEPRGKK